MLQKRSVRLGVGLVIILLTLIFGYSVIRPLHLRWGATDAELARPMPGDLDGARWTRAISIDATPEQIWPWLVQFGQGRGGWYSYDWLENLLGFDIHSADQILAEEQNPQLGDPICMAEGICTSFVSVIEPPQWFGWQAKDDAGKAVWSFVFGLVPINATQTRLVVRESFDPVAIPTSAALALEIPDVVMELKMLNTLKQRAEGQRAWGFTTLYEITIWLTTFAIAAIAGGLYLRRSAWQKPLVVGAVALLVLLTLTFLFLPLPLRGGLVVLLLLGLGWSWRGNVAAQRQDLHNSPAA